MESTVEEIAKVLRSTDAMVEQFAKQVQERVRHPVDATGSGGHQLTTPWASFVSATGLTLKHPGQVLELSRSTKRKQAYGRNCRY